MRRGATSGARLGIDIWDWGMADSVEEEYKNHKEGV